MAIINCPECGRQVSDKAPACPGCGVEIAGKVTKCTHCGANYFSSMRCCPKCQHPTRLVRADGPAKTTGAESVASENEAQTPNKTSADTPTPTDHNGKDAPRGKRKTTLLIASFLIALLVAGVGFYFYSNAKTTKEKEAYTFAMASDDPFVLQTYLDNNPDAPESHIKSVMARLDFIRQQDEDWANALASGSRTALEDYMAKHPDNDHSMEAKHKIDSIDWAEAVKANTIAAMQQYLIRHANGEHVDEAHDAIKEIKTNTVQEEDLRLVSQSVRHFFQSLNARDEVGLQTSVTPIISNFLGKANATRADVVTFMNKIYKEDVTAMTWSVNNDYEITKKEIGDEQYEYTVGFSAIQKIERSDPDKETEAHYQIKAGINPDGLITAMSMTKILE